MLSQLIEGARERAHSTISIQYFFFLFPPLRQPSLRRPIVDIVLRIDPPHRVLSADLFLRLGRDARDARDDEERVGYRRRHPEVAADRGNRSVDIDRLCRLIRLMSRM